MKSYITRRWRCLIQVKSLDENTTVSDNLLADHLLACGNIGKDEKRLIQTVCVNMSDFDMIATALRKQHADTHKRESRSKHEENKPRAYRTSTYSNGTCRPHFRMNPSGRAIKAVVDLEDEDEDLDDDGGDRESDSNECVSVLKENEFESVEDQIKQDVVCAFMLSGWRRGGRVEAGHVEHDWRMDREHAHTHICWALPSWRK